MNRLCNQWQRRPFSPFPLLRVSLLPNRQPSRPRLRDHLRPRQHRNRPMVQLTNQPHSHLLDHHCSHPTNRPVDQVKCRLPTLPCSRLHNPVLHRPLIPVLYQVRARLNYHLHAHLFALLNSQSEVRRGSRREFQAASPHANPVDSRHSSRRYSLPEVHRGNQLDSHPSPLVSCQVCCPLLLQVYSPVPRLLLSRLPFHLDSLPRSRLVRPPRYLR